MESRPITPEAKRTLIGLSCAVPAYLIWGLSPIYFKTLKSVPAIEILMHRIIWSFVFLVPVILFQGRWREFQIDPQQPPSNPAKNGSPIAGCPGSSIAGCRLAFIAGCPGSPIAGCPGPPVAGCPGPPVAGCPGTSFARPVAGPPAQPAPYPG